MHFSHLNDGSGSKAGKLAVVAGLHVLVGIVFIHSLNARHITLPKMPDSVLVMIQPEIPPPPPPPEPPRPTPRAAPPQVVAPTVEVDVPPPQVEPPVQASTEPDPAPTPAPAEPAPAAQPSANNGAMRSAVLADANGCATPQYPANAARNGETGTVTLALLVGADGKVSSSRVQRSSGYRDLDKAAVNALSLCKFKPAMNGGVPEAGWAQIAYVWQLQD